MKTAGYHSLPTDIRSYLTEMRLSTLSPMTPRYGYTRQRGDDDFFNSRSLQVFISKLRRRLEPDPRIRIVNVRGEGYKLLVNE